MNPDPISLHALPSRTDAAGGAALSLDQRIALAEQHLLARQDRLHQRAQALGQRVRRAFAPRHLVLPVLGLMVSLFTTWKLLRVGGPALSEAREPAPRPGLWRFTLGLLAELLWPRL